MREINESLSGTNMIGANLDGVGEDSLFSDVYSYEDAITYLADEMHSSIRDLEHLFKDVESSGYSIDFKEFPEMIHIIELRLKNLSKMVFDSGENIQETTLVQGIIAFRLLLATASALLAAYNESDKENTYRTISLVLCLSIFGQIFDSLYPEVSKMQLS